ncbi:hypothetical protein E4U43_002193 [Claviceps pusilla]|uniref:PH domain-containing protein n=1 Tax=Claviceps pusilla TaxID=123648 RepID=A0A9P7N6N0_9HYPO|nr:hypothetical protein E4U43_002193 [Claviceps pusilla]
MGGKTGKVGKIGKILQHQQTVTRVVPDFLTNKFPSPLAMDCLDGYLQVPPDRTQFLGKQSWKTRYVAVGSPQSIRRYRQGSQALSRTTSSLVNSVISKSVNKNETDDLYLSVFKSKDDWEPMQRWPLAHVSDCQVQLVSNRKQEPVLPTLVVTITDNQRKRRSSRAAGFISSNKEPGLKTLWFRTPPDDHHPSLHEWAQFIMAKRSHISSGDNPVSPVSASLFQTPNYDKTEHFSRPGSGNRGHQHMGSIATHSAGPLDPCATLSSDSPSLRSRRSDISSPSSHNHSIQRVPFPIPEQHYTTILPGDIVAPGHHGEYQGQFIEGWTSARGRSCTLGSPIRGGRDSIGSSQSQQLSPIVDVTSPPAPGETILDRAFQLGQIPGAETPMPGQEHLSSIARFDALMRESDEKARRRHAAQRKRGKLALQTAFGDEDADGDDDGDSSDCGEGDGDGDGESDSESAHHSDDQFPTDHNMTPLLSPSAQRALAFITSGGRNESERSSKCHRPSVSRSHLSFQDGKAPPPVNSTSSSRPHTAHGKSRPKASRSQSTSHLTPITITRAPDAPLFSTSHDEAHPSTTIADKRLSNSSDKRLSFTEFTKKLSSTSSLLLVQTSASVGSSHASSETDSRNGSSTPREDLTVRGSGPPSRTQKRDDQEQRCTWRKSVGIVSAEGRLL